MRTDTLILGAVAYDPKVVTIWDGFQRWFESKGLGFDYILYTNYERLVAAQLRGEVDVAWNSPLAWLQAEAVARQQGRAVEAIAMRDTDQDLTSVILVREDGPKTLRELAGKTVAVGAGDSPQATLIPLQHLAEAEVSVDVQLHDVLVGKHGDHVGGERSAVKALLAGQADAACILDANQLTFSREGTVPPGALRVLATTAPYDHCNFTVVAPSPTALIARFRELLMSMSFRDPEVRPLLELEGLTAWRAGRTSGYAVLERAVARSGALETFVASYLRSSGTAV